ncbi:DUF1192 domain-containing protein [Brevundimonas sp.]|uniref:DUF1192 domain-containing protein n=1 Tax=Brevundimonas sp. TaxID=1871086 RepID=UPI0019BAECDC|nr:DUF1192 domain-containing protein [Brevundimonas sp.]MBD3836018.1 DUF1192 domain-containing protein [Brevundimonas sp.]
MFEDLEPRPRRDEALSALRREDLDSYSVEDLTDRVAELEAEIARSRAAMDAKRAKKSAADALFTFRP